MLAKITSYLFDYPTMILLALLLFFFYDKKFGVYFGVVSAASAGFQFLLKCLINRPRPYLASVDVRNIYEAIGSSFSSGHSVTAMGIALFVGWVVVRSNLSISKKLLSFLGLGVYVILNLCNRTYLGQHYLSDIFAGYAIMVIIFIASVWIYPYFCRFWDKLIKKSKKEEVNG